jgi:hypothetical protein
VSGSWLGDGGFDHHHARRQLYSSLSLSLSLSQLARLLPLIKKKKTCDIDPLSLSLSLKG